eukprot:m.145965 g.145965  ORF g.145965 m.145965 type:complete len:291 (-) comp17752_c0_seq1:242-1114(-)
MTTNCDEAMDYSPIPEKSSDRPYSRRRDCFDWFSLAVQFGILLSLLWIGTTLDIAYNRFKDVDIDESVDHMSDSVSTAIGDGVLKAGPELFKKIFDGTIPGVAESIFLWDVNATAHNFTTVIHALDGLWENVIEEHVSHSDRTTVNAAKDGVLSILSRVEEMQRPSRNVTYPKDIPAQTIADFSWFFFDQINPAKWKELLPACENFSKRGQSVSWKATYTSECYDLNMCTCVIGSAVEEDVCKEFGDPCQCSWDANDDVRDAMSYIQRGCIALATGNTTGLLSSPRIATV